MKGTAVDELLMELEHSIQNNRPIAIDIDETDSGERVRYTWAEKGRLR